MTTRTRTTTTTTTRTSCSVSRRLAVGILAVAVMGPASTARCRWFVSAEEERRDRRRHLQLSTSGLVLNKRKMILTRHAGLVAKQAFDAEPVPSMDGWEYLWRFNSEPDQALVARRDGVCFGAFRGTTRTWSDWRQNFLIGKQQVCVGGGCCSVHQGWDDAYNADFRVEFEEAIRDCARDCDPDRQDDCVVLTGHSQGAAIAAVAALYLSDLDPTVVTFGQPSAIEEGCGLVNSDRWYRYINTKSSKTFTFGVVYDPVCFVGGYSHYGHAILLSDDPTGVAYLGLDSNDYFGPPNVNGFQSHRMRAQEGAGQFPGYLDRIENIMRLYHNSDSYRYPIRTTGYATGSLCTEDAECESRNCDRENTFSFERCAAKQRAGLLAGGDACFYDRNCKSGRCDGSLGPAVCKPKLGPGAWCDEHSDCLSGTCSWRFQCADFGGRRRLRTLQGTAGNRKTVLRAPLYGTGNDSTHHVMWTVVASFLVASTVVVLAFGVIWFRRGKS